MENTYAFFCLDDLSISTIENVRASASNDNDPSMKLSSHLQVISIESTDQMTTQMLTHVHSQSKILADLPSHSSSASSNMAHNIMDMGTVHQSHSSALKLLGRQEYVSSTPVKSFDRSDVAITDTEIVLVNDQSADEMITWYPLLEHSDPISHETRSIFF